MDVCVRVRGTCMGDAPGFKAILKRGALVTAANWPIVLVQFVAESLFKLLLGVPIVGGIFLVVLVVGHDVADFLRGDAREIVATILGALTEQPAALVGFLVSMLIVLIGGAAMMFIVKAGAVVTLADALGVPILVEGIESEAAHAAVLTIGCSSGQGWYFGKPMDAEQAAQLIARREVQPSREKPSRAA